MNIWLQYLTVAASVFLADVAWTKYFIEVSKRRAVIAGLWSAAIFLFGIYATVSVVKDWKMLIAACVGAFVGTYVTVRFSKH